jgi:hypothetical protein
VPEHQVTLRTRALALLPQVAPAERVWLHWGLSLAAYPFFRDVVSTVGRLLDLQGEFDSSQVLQRLRETWGQRTTVDRATQRVIVTLAAWGIIRRTSLTGHTYRSTPRPCTADEDLGLWLLECVLHSLALPDGARGRDSGHDTVPLLELLTSPVAFPFDLTGHAAALRRSDRFEVSRQGLDLEMVAPRDRP